MVKIPPVVGASAVAGPDDDFELLRPGSAALVKVEQGSLIGHSINQRYKETMESAELTVARLTAELFKVIGHPVRVRALDLLLRGESSVGALAESLGMELSQLSQHLGALRRVNIVDTRRAGTTVYYSVHDPRMSQLLAVARQLLASNLEDSRELLVTIEDMMSAGARATR